MYLLDPGNSKLSTRVQLLGSGTILREVMAGADLLANDWGIAGDVWSCTSFTQLAREASDVMRWNMLNPTAEQKTSYVAQLLGKTQGPVIASTDYMRMFADQIRAYMPKGRNYRVLGTDGFGRSDTRTKLREHFEVDRHFVVLAALKQLADEGVVPVSQVANAIKKYAINPAKINPLYA
jgi:pyruvate dehydrogenase E1 component